jgi:hypothetical protein
VLGIRIHIDPYPFVCLGYGSVFGMRIRIYEHGNKRLLYRRMYVFWPILSIHLKIQLFVTSRSDQDPDSHEPALVWNPGSGSARRLKSGYLLSALCLPEGSVTTLIQMLFFDADTDPGSGNLFDSGSGMEKIRMQHRWQRYRDLG